MNEILFRKSIYVAKQNLKNSILADKNGLTDNQHEAITYVCSFRHELHCNQEDLFVCESANFSHFAEMLCGKLHTLLHNVGIEYNKFDYYSEFIELPDDQMCETDAEYEDGLRQVHEFCEKVDADIIEFLQKIDKRYKTEYAPTLIARSRLI